MGLATNTEWLGFIAETTERLAIATHPLDALEAALPEFAELVGVKACRLRREPGDESPGLRAVIQDDDGPLATIGVTVGPNTQDLDESGAAFLQALARVASLAVQKSKLEKRLATELRLGRDLDEAALLQQSLQPDCVPDQLPIWGLNLPARKLSGDFFDFYRLGDDRIAFALGDVSGKGINAALLMAKTARLFRYLGKRLDSPAALLAIVNGELFETATRGMFVTMVAGYYRPRSGRVTFANAGHQPPLFRRPDRSYETFPAAAPPLGIRPSITLADEDIELAGGEFYVFSDGLTEYRYQNGELLGVDGLIQLIEFFAEQSPARRLEGLLETLDREGGWAARDDLTVLAIDDSWVRHSGFDRTASDAVPSYCQKLVTQVSGGAFG